MKPDVHAVLAAAIDAKLLPTGATVPAAEPTRPWPVVLLTALGAWLAALPLLGVVALLLGDLLTRSVGPYFVGVLLLAGAVVVLRSAAVALFVEQLAVPALLVGAGALGFGLFRDLQPQAGAAVLALVALALGALVRGAWLRVLLGAAAASLLAVALADATRNDSSTWMRLWWAWHAALLVWLATLAAARRAASAAAAAVAEPLAAGWLLMVVAGLAWWSGLTFLAGAAGGGGIGGEVVRELGRRPLGLASWSVPQAASGACAIAAAAWAMRRWLGLRRPRLAAVAAVPAALAWFMPTLGAAWLALAVCATTHRWRLAGCAALAAAWIIGAFYYQLDWPLAIKAVVLAVAGAVLGVLAWGESRSGAPAQSGRHAEPNAADAPDAPDAADAADAADTAAPASARRAALGIGASVALVLAVANVGIWQKEALIRQGRPVFVELAPVDPRSLMQGDFMRLNFGVPGPAPGDTAGWLWGRRPHVAARLDARGVATLRRLERGAPLAEGELRIELTPKDGRWILVSDAWFFAEGDAARYERAKYGEFRVEPGGRALLVGLRGANLEPL